MKEGKVVALIEETMSEFMCFKIEQAAAKAQNLTQGLEFSMTRSLAVLKEMVDL